MPKDRALVKLSKQLDRFEMASALEVADDDRCKALAMMLRGRDPLTGAYEPAFAKCGVANLCHRTGVNYKTVVQVYKDWKRSEAVVKAAQALPGIIEGIAEDATNKEITCGQCEGLGRIFIKGSEKPEIDKRCLVCEGSGKVTKSGDPVARKQILEMMELAGRGVMNVDARGSNVSIGAGESMEDALKAARAKKEEVTIDGVD